MTRPSRLVLLSSIHLLSCDGIGRSLVDSAPRGGDGTSECTTPHSCTWNAAALTIEPFTVLSPRLSACSDGSTAAIGLEELRARGACRCEELSLSLLSGGATARMLEGLAFQDCVLRVESDEPTSLHLTNASLERTRLELVGPIDLTLGSGGDIVQTQVVGRSSEHGSPSVHLEELRASSISVTGPMPLSLLRTTIVQSSLTIDELDVESSVLLEATVKSTWLSAVDADLDGVSIATTHGSMSASTAKRTSIGECTTFLIAGSSLEGSQLRGCEDRLRLYASEVGSSLLDGAIEADGSTVIDAMLGVAAPTSVDAWSTSFSGTAFCSQVQALRLGGADVRCSTCDAPSAGLPVEVCRVAETALRLTHNACAPLASTESVEVCTAPSPVRERPNR